MNFSKPKNIETSRFDTKLPKTQKELFEYATYIGGYRTLTDFILEAAREKAEQVMAKHESFLTTKRDQELFFNTLMNPPKPNKALRDLAKFYKAQTGGKK